MRCTSLLALLVVATATAFAAEPETAWRIDFNNAEEIGGVHYVVRDGKDTSDGLIFNVADGALTFGASFTDDSQGYDHGVLAWGESMPWGFWQWKPSPFKKIDAAKYPIVEFRARKTPETDAALCLAPTFDSDKGRGFAQLHFPLTDEWQTFAFRFSPLSSTSVPTAAREVTGMVFWVQHNRKPSAFQIDWVRVRAFTPKEKAADEAIVDILGSYELPAWKQPFFVYGPYGPSILGTACQGGLEGAYGDMTRAHMNYLMCPHDLSYYRYQGRDGKTREEDVADFLDANRRAVQAAADAGIRMSLDVRGFAKDFSAHGLDFIRPGVQTVADAFRDNPTVLGYTVDDEPNTSRLVEVVAVKKLFEQADPAKLCAFPLNDPYWASDFDPYTTLVALDRYPITLDQRDVDAVANQLGEYSKASKKPFWFIGQAIGQKPWWPEKKGNYATPTEAEFLRMAFAALGRGAKGLLFFDWYHRPWQTLVDRYGNPEPLYDAAQSLGERIAGVGSILLRAERDAKGAEITAAGPFEVCALSLENPKATLYIVSNTDLDAPHSLDVEGTALHNHPVVLDLDTLQGTPGNRLVAKDVKPGDGRFFAVTNRKGAKALEDEVTANRAREAERVARPDRIIAERWGDAAEMKAVDETLDSCARRLGDIEKKVSAGVKVPKPGFEAEWQRCMTQAKAYDDLRSRWIAAERQGLAEAAEKLRANANALGDAVGSKEPKSAK